MKSDVLFITWNCTDCCRVKVEFPEFGKYAFGNDVGKSGQNLVVIQTYSDIAARYALDEIGDFNSDVFTPALLTHDNKKITDVEEMIIYLKESYD